MGILSALFTLLVAASPPAGDGIALETACLDCHRANQPAGEVPRIEGQQRDYLLNQLVRFRDRHREGFPMAAFAAGIDDAAAARIADALAQRPWPEAADPPPPGSATRGAQRAAELACASCHGEQYLGSGDVPRLAGQQPGYVARQLQGFGDAERFHPPTGIGSRMYALDAADASDIAAFLHSLEGSVTR
jgi:cytochrome c553